MSDLILLAVLFVMLCMGLYVLIRGKIAVAKDQVLRGVAARGLGILLLLPLPLLLLSLWTYGKILGGSEYSLVVLLMIKWGSLFLCALGAYLIALFGGQPVAPDEPPGGVKPKDPSEPTAGA